MRRRYTDEEKATVYIALQANQQNAKRTQRDTGIPLQTIKDWKHKWEREGVPSEIAEATPIALEMFVVEAERIRNKAIVLMEDKLPDATALQLATIVGILTDKINISKGIATSRQEITTKLTLPKREEVKELFEAFVSEALSRARDRDIDIVKITDAEIVEEQVLAITEHSEI